MKPVPFDYARPADVASALTLAGNRDTAKFIAGREAFRQLFVDWAKEHPEWRLDLNIIGGNMTTTEQARLLEKARVGTAPDCANVDSFTIPLFIEQGVLQPLDKYFTKEQLGDLFPNVRKVMTGPDGHVYAW